LNATRKRFRRRIACTAAQHREKNDKGLMTASKIGFTISAMNMDRSFKLPQLCPEQH